MRITDEQPYSAASATGEQPHRAARATGEQPYSAAWATGEQPHRAAPAPGEQPHHAASPTAPGAAADPCAPANAAEALAYARAGLGFLAAADPTELTGAERAELLRGLAAAESQQLAARSAVLSGFDRAGDHAADGQPTSRTWLRWQARVTRAAAGAAMAWMRRLAAHPPVDAPPPPGPVPPPLAPRHLPP